MSENPDSHSDPEPAPESGAPSSFAILRHADISALLEDQRLAGRRVLWSATNQLQADVIALSAHEHVEPHNERDLDLTLIVLTGSGIITVDHTNHTELASVSLSALACIVIPAGCRRSLRAGAAGLGYMTAHRARPSLMPARRGP